MLYFAPKSSSKEIFRWNERIEQHFTIEVKIRRFGAVYPKISIQMLAHECYHIRTCGTICLTFCAYKMVSYSSPKLPCDSPNCHYFVKKNMSSPENVLQDDNTEEIPQKLQGKKLSWNKLRRNDSLDMESGKFNGHHHSSKVRLPIFLLAYVFAEFKCLIICVLCAEWTLEFDTESCISEHRSGVWRHRDVTFVCICEHLHRRYKTQRWYTWSSLPDFLHHHLNPSRQVRLHRFACKWQWRR